MIYSDLIRATDTVDVGIIDMKFTQQLYDVSLFSVFQSSVHKHKIQRRILSVVSENEVKRTLNTDGIFAYLAVVSIKMFCFCLFVCSLFHCSGCYAGCQQRRNTPFKTSRKRVYIQIFNSESYPYMRVESKYFLEKLHSYEAVYRFCGRS